MAKYLVIVESPAKVKTIKKFLGKNYEVAASNGHVRDLPKSQLGVDVEHDFEPKYITIRGKGDILANLRKEVKKADKVYLATDPDREGEAISWHLATALKLNDKDAKRITFNEITKNAVKASLKNPREIDMNLVDAQQARRVLDRMVGYKISPVLWAKVKRGLSAGRVQSVALRIICDREDEINAFIPEEYWTIDVVLNVKGEKKPLVAKFYGDENGKIQIHNQAELDAILKEIESSEYKVLEVKKGERTKKPPLPFRTSTLQQEASKHLNFSTQKTMRLAQQLYEGVDIKGSGTVGLITYLRTDSTRVSEEAEAAAAEYIGSNYGADYVGGSADVKKNTAKIQDAHEAIRPSHIELDPEEIKDSLSKDQYKLYKLIWNRFLASQMAPARFKAVNAGISNGDYLFKATGSKLVFDGFLRVYQQTKDGEENKLLPHLGKGEQLDLIKVEGVQNFTQPPARFTEASLVKDLEDKDIGRPSTYAPIVATLMDRKYVTKDKKSLVPTDLGFIVIDMMQHYFKEIVDTGFTAQMEENLDDIEAKGVRWKSVIEDFYGDFKKELDVAEEEIQKVEFEVELTGETCEKCGKPMAVKHGRFGAFAACTGYPECKNTKPIVQSVDVKCPKCGKDIVMRRSKRGRVFYGCSGYPDCTQSYWNKPVDKKCPKCGSLLVEKKTKEHKYACSNSECDYKE